MRTKKYIPLEEKFRILSRLLHDIIESQIFTKNDLTSNQFIILKILYASGKKSIHEIADILKISRSAASKNVDILVNKNLIKRNEDKKDRRYLNILLSEEGATLINKYHTLCDDKIRHVLSHFNEKEKDIFHQMLDKYIFYFINGQENLALFCMQCGGKYEGCCMIGSIKNKCFFNMQDK